MQSEEEQLVSDSKNPSQASLSGAWPPKILRLAIAAVTTAALGYLVLKTMYPIFSVPVEIATFPEQSPLWLYERLERTQVQVDGKNFSLVFGVIGAILGASCVLFSYGARSIKAIIIGVLASAALGVVGANLSNRMFDNMRLSVNSGKDVAIMGIALDAMKQSIVGYSLLWGLIGLGVGLGIGSFHSVGKSLVAGISGLVGGVLGAMIYVILTAQFSIGTAMNRALPDNSTTQAIWLVTFTVVIAVCIGLGCGEKRPKEAA